MPILPLFLLIFIGVPLIEIYFLIEVGSAIGAIPTVIAVVFTAVLGVTLIRIQGFSTLQKAQKSMAQGIPPAMEMFEGIMLLFAALCLLIPGFFTDAVGFLLLIPPFRRALASLLIGSAVLKNRFSNANSGFSGGDFFEGEYENLTPEQQHERNKEKLQHQHIIEGTVESTDDAGKDAANK
ncbi:MAG: FxsA family protein [gamma proteobacterium symbiont of Bathyaustriella thionipta]|nr:FxsA family protein [gamma proteobacterium symbiont of Bathyaustriella thionipta]MCU7948753.1 FxsA family protein [gamma proteobacterium symbiont of Bathyaustriella thionipta]MCU7953551.1 FxsA family protein [gamma proteobacterium symbiont of Bathyaustriella thionipta]MCU7955236.1 FxsA family protein [gamma proteobacterium symbiont of Bathyaustriella thionipta]MCU7967028.1 FxsA family protein [gamma proteobacterium symbiont of Bathyaustriella thionipta]